MPTGQLGNNLDPANAVRDETFRMMKVLIANPAHLAVRAHQGCQHVINMRLLPVRAGRRDERETTRS